MKKILVGIIILMLLVWSPQINTTPIIKTVIKDTVMVYAVTTNLFYIIVPSMIEGQGYGRNVPELAKIDTSYLIKYPNDKTYTSIKRDSLRRKLNELLL